MSSSSCILREKENKNIYGWGYLIVILIMMVFELNRRVQRERESVFVAVVMVYYSLWNVCRGSAIMPKILKQYHPFLYSLYMHEQ